MSDSDDGMRGPAAKKKKKSDVVKKTYRCTVELNNKDSSYTEVSWYDLVAKERAKNRKAGESADQNDQGGAEIKGLDPYASDDEDDLKALAAQFERKYADNKPKKKGVKRRKNFDDLGDGYDESDPFIDNSECFDENVPQEITTAFGGFYINIGVLEFKDNKNVVVELSDSSDSEDEDKKEKKSAPKKKSVPNGVGPGIPIKKAKVINTKRKARIINTAVKSGPKQTNGSVKTNSKAEDSAPAEGKEKKTETQASVKIPTGDGSSNSIINNGSIKITAVSGSSSTSTAKPLVNNVSSTSAAKSSEPARTTPAIKAADTTTRSNPSTTVKSSRPAGASTEATKVEKTISVKPASQLMKQDTKSEKKDLKTERKTSAKSTVGKSSPKPPELIDLEAQLNDLAGAFESPSQRSSSGTSSPKSSNKYSKPTISSSSNNSSVVTTLKNSAISITRIPAQGTAASSPVSKESAVIDTESWLTGRVSGASDGKANQSQSRKESKEKSSKDKSVMHGHDGKGPTDKNMMYSHDPASILSTFSNSVSSSVSTKTTDTDKSKVNPLPRISSAYSLSTADLKNSRTSVKPSVSQQQSYTSVSTHSSNANAMSRMSPGSSPAHRGASPVNKADKSSSGQRKSSSSSLGNSTTYKKSEKEVSGSELSQQLGRQAVQQMLKSKTSDSSNPGLSSGGGISVKSIYNESNIGNGTSSSSSVQKNSRQAASNQQPSQATLTPVYTSHHQTSNSHYSPYNQIAHTQSFPAHQLTQVQQFDPYLQTANLQQQQKNAKGKGSQSVDQQRLLQQQYSRLTATEAQLVQQYQLFGSSPEEYARMFNATKK